VRRFGLSASAPHSLSVIFQNKMSEEIKISAAANVEIPAYLALNEKGYKVYWKRADENTEYWYAKKNNLIFMAEGPIVLLGVVGVYELRGSNWKASDAEIVRFMEKYSK